VAKCGKRERSVGRRHGRRPLAHNGIDAETGGRLLDREPAADAAAHYRRRRRRRHRRRRRSSRVRRPRAMYRGLRRFVRGRRRSRRRRGSSGRRHLTVVQQVQAERYASQLGGRQR